MDNPVVHFEVLSSDGEKLQGFYAGVFGWRFEQSGPSGYAMVQANGSGIGGGVGTAGPGEQPWLTFYVAVPDPQAAIDRAVELGGRELVAVHDVPGAGVTVGVFADPDGHPVGVVRA